MCALCYVMHFILPSCACFVKAKAAIDDVLHGTIAEINFYNQLFEFNATIVMCDNLCSLMQLRFT